MIPLGRGKGSQWLDLRRDNYITILPRSKLCHNLDKVEFLVI